MSNKRFLVTAILIMILEQLVFYPATFSFLKSRDFDVNNHFNTNKKIIVALLIELLERLFFYSATFSFLKSRD